MAAPDNDIVDKLPNPLAVRSDRRRVVNALTVIALGAIAASTWPTESRKLEKRARAFHDALARGDSAGAQAFLSPKARGSLAGMKASRAEVVDVQVADGGQAAVVTIADAATGTRAVTPWVRIDFVWYRD